MVAGFDRYFQIAKCFRDEDLRADRQPEFTQIDCEMSFVEQEDIIATFEGMAKHLFKTLRGVELTEPFIRMPWSDAMKYYGSDKPDLRFGMKFVELMDIMKGHGFSVFDNATYIGGICAEGAASYTRKQLDALTEFVKRPQIGAKGMVPTGLNEPSMENEPHSTPINPNIPPFFRRAASVLLLIVSAALAAIVLCIGLSLRICFLYDGLYRFITEKIVLLWGQNTHYNAKSVIMRIKNTTAE